MPLCGKRSVESRHTCLPLRENLRAGFHVLRTLNDKSAVDFQKTSIVIQTFEHRKESIVLSICDIHYKYFRKIHLDDVLKSVVIFNKLYFFQASHIKSIVAVLRWRTTFFFYQFISAILLFQKPLYLVFGFGRQKAARGIHHFTVFAKHF
jgi:hypothetical protein